MASTNFMLPADTIGTQFVQQYYRILNAEPSQLYRFYKSDSSLAIVDETHDDTDNACARGVQGITDRIARVRFSGCKVEIERIDCQSSVDGGVLVLVSGQMSTNGQSFRRFVQLFMLATQINGYYVHNDILRFFRDAEAHECEQEEVTETATVAPTTQAATQQQPVQRPHQPAQEPASTAKATPTATAPAVTPASSKPQQQQDTTKQHAQPQKAAPVAPAPTAPAEPPKPKTWAGIAGTSSASGASAPAATTPAAPSKPAPTTTPAPTQQVRPAQPKKAAASASSSSAAAGATSSSPAPKSDRQASVYVRGVPESASVDEVRALFQSMKGFKNLSVFPEKGFGFVDFDSQENANRCINDSGEIRLHESTLTLEIRNAQPPRDKGPRPAGRGRGAPSVNGHQEKRPISAK